MDGNRWYKVKLEDGSYYYVMAKYLTKKEGISLSPVKSRVNMRSKAGTDQTLKAKLMTSTPVAWSPATKNRQRREVVQR